MSLDPGGNGEHNGSASLGTAAGSQQDRQVLLAEFAALRAETDRRANVQWNVFALQLGSAGVIASLAISTASDIALLLLIPLSSYMLGNRYVLHDYHIKLISRYIRDSLSGRLNDLLAWEQWKADHAAPGTERRRWFTPAGWNMFHPTRLAFEGISWLALIAAPFAAFSTWRNHAPPWYLVLGFALLWLLGTVVTSFLHKSFDQSSGR
jgi:hypothetical protein